MPKQLITPDLIAKESLMQLKNSLHLANVVHRDYKSDFTGGQGDTVSIRKPVKFYTADGEQRVNQDVEEKTTSITIDQRKHVSWEFSTQDLTLSIQEYSERYIKPAMITLANTMDRKGHSLYADIANSVGTPGVTPSTFGALGDAAQRLDEMAVPSDMRKMILNPAARYKIAGDQTTIGAWDAKVRSAYQNAQIGTIAQFQTLSSQNVTAHRVGNYTGSTPLVNGGNQNVTYTGTGDRRQTLVTDGWAASRTGVLRKGDVFTIAGVFAVNPVPGEGTTGKLVMPYLQQFTVLADANSTGTGAASLTISPAIITSGPQQTVSAAPLDNAAITVMGAANTAYTQNLGIHKNALALVNCPLELPDGAVFKARQSADGLSVRVVKAYDIDTDKDVIRIDTLYGWKSIYPELAVRLWG